MSSFRFRVFTAAVILLFTEPSSAGRLDAAGDRTRDSTEEAPDADESDDDSDENSDCGELCQGFLRWVVAAPWTVPYELTYEHPSPRFAYARYPYHEGSGYLRAWVPADAQSPELEPVVRSLRHPDSIPSGARSWALATSLEAGSDFSGLHRGGATVRLFMPVPLELEGRFFYFAEANGEPGNDWASVSNLNLSWRFAATRSVQFRSGIGYQHWYEDAETESSNPLRAQLRHRPGFQFHYGMDAYPGRPFTLSAEARLGNLGQALVWELRGTVGVALGPVEVFGGYQALDIGGSSLGSPLLGVRGYW